MKLERRRGVITLSIRVSIEVDSTKPFLTRRNSLTSSLPNLRARMRSGTFCLRKLLRQVLQNLTDTEPDRVVNMERTP
jgi:hypothetical protein